MAHRQKIRSYVLMCSCLMALPPGWAALSCCRRDLSNGSTSYQLSDAPDPTCSTHWSADGVTVVDESGQTDQTRVRHAGPQELILKRKHRDVIFQKDCPALKESVMLHCNVPCRSSDEPTAAPAEWQRTNNAEIRCTSDGVFIIILLLLIIFITAVP